jgi:hypothetical protein
MYTSDFSCSGQRRKMFPIVFPPFIFPIEDFRNTSKGCVSLRHHWNWRQCIANCIASSMHILTHTCTPHPVDHHIASHQSPKAPWVLSPWDQLSFQTFHGSGSFRKLSRRHVYMATVLQMADTVEMNWSRGKATLGVTVQQGYVYDLCPTNRVRLCVCVF